MSSSLSASSFMFSVFDIVFPFRVISCYRFVEWC